MVCSSVLYPSFWSFLTNSRYRRQLLMVETFSITIQRGLRRRAKRIIWNAVIRLSSDGRLPPLARLWLVHSGEARIRSIFLTWAATLLTDKSWIRSLKTLASGKLSLNVRRARSHLSKPAMILAPARRAPQLQPPAPQKRSMARRFLSRPPEVTVSLRPFRFFVFDWASGILSPHDKRGNSVLPLFEFVCVSLACRIG